MYLLNNPLTLKLQDCVWGKNVIKGNEGIHSFRHTHGNNITKACLYNAELPPNCILEKSNFNFRHVRLCDLDIPREKWLNYLQTVETFTLVFIVRLLPFWKLID